MRTIKVVVLLVQQLQHGFTKNATKVSPNLTVAQIQIQIQIQIRSINVSVTTEKR